VVQTEIIVRHGSVTSASKKGNYPEIVPEDQHHRMDINGAEIEEAVLWAARCASKQQQPQEGAEEHVNVASMESLTTQVSPWIPTVRLHSWKIW
jgi:hypothetical protein